MFWGAVVFAIPAGVIIWLLANNHFGDLSIAEQFIEWPNPFAKIFGFNGVILLVYIIAISANEIVIPTTLMLTVRSSKIAGIGPGSGIMFELDSTADTANVLHAGGWILHTAINLMLFSLLHNSCSTTIMTI